MYNTNRNCLTDPVNENELVEISTEYRGKLKKMLENLETELFGTNYDKRMLFEEYKVYWITINTNCLKIDSEFHKCIDGLFSKIKSKRLKDCVSFFTLEFFTEKGQHLHLHTLIFKKKGNKRLGFRAFLNFFLLKKWVKNKSAVDVKEVRSKNSLTTQRKCN